VIKQTSGIYFFREEVEIEIPFSENLLRTWVLNVIDNRNGGLGELNFIFCGDEYLLGINQQYLNHDEYTDIITFQLEPGLVDGDIFISLERVMENALQRSIEFRHEFLRVLIHGVLHMLGYTDKTEADANRMRLTEDECIAGFFDLVSDDTN